MFFALWFANVVILYFFPYFSATPKGPTVFPLIQCGSGIGNSITLGCLATDFTPSSLTYTWSKGGTALTDFIQYPPTLNGEYYTGISQISVNKQDWENRQTFKCVAKHSAGNAEANITKESKIIFLFLSYKRDVLNVCSDFSPKADG